MQVCLGVYKGVTTTELDELAAETAAHLSSTHPDYGLLAARIAVSNLHKNTSKSFAETAARLHAYVEPKSGLPAPLLSDMVPCAALLWHTAVWSPCVLVAGQVYKFICEHKDTLDNALVYERDYMYDYFGFKTLEVWLYPDRPHTGLCVCACQRAYLLKINGKIVERPQHMLMRVACGIYCLRHLPSDV